MKIEDIPDTATVARLIDFPRMYNDVAGILWDNNFIFYQDRATGVFFGESVFWDKYAPLPEGVHALGCRREAIKRHDKPDLRYVGYIAALAGEVRAIRTNSGHTFQVRHEPSEGLFHAEIHYSPNPDIIAFPFTKAARAELKFALRGVFGKLVQHSCQTS